MSMLCSRCQTPSAAAMNVIGTGAMTNSFDDIEKGQDHHASAGQSPLKPSIPGARIKRQFLKRGTRLIVIDPRKTELAEMADVLSS